MAHFSYPKTYEENLIYRNKILDKMKADNEFAHVIKAMCRKDFLYWANVFCYVHEPNRRKPRVGRIPFITYKFQDKVAKDIMKSIDKGEDLVIEKSRDMGMSWLVVLIFQWYWLFGESGNDFLLGSINAAKTDTFGALDTLFEKLRYNFKLQPDIFIPAGFEERFHSGMMKMINPETSSYIRGDTNKFFATSGRYKAILFDEFSKWPRGEDSMGWQSASDASPCKIAVSSANGRANVFYELVSGRRGKIKKLRVHWREHPLKDTRWYNREKKRRSKQDLAAEIDMDYLASIGSRAAENWNFDVHVKEIRRIGNLPLELNCDFNVNPMSWCVSQTLKGVRNTFREYVEETTRTEVVIQKFIVDYSIHEHKVIYLFGDASGRYGTTNSRLTDWQIIERKLKAAGWHVINKVPMRNPSHVDRLNITNKRLKDYEHNDKSWEVIHPQCTQLIESIESTERSETGILKNGLEHLFDAWSYGLCQQYPLYESKIFQMKRH